MKQNVNQLVAAVGQTMRLGEWIGAVDAPVESIEGDGRWTLDVTTDKRLSLAHWDGLRPPPAAIRCPSTQREQLDPDTSRVTGCMLLDGHDGRCVFAE